MRADSKSAKRQSSCLCFFSLLGFSYVNAACKMLVKLTPGDNIIIKHKCTTSHCFELAIGILHHTVLSTKMHPTLPVNTTKNYVQLYTLHSTLYISKVSVNILAEKYDEIDPWSQGQMRWCTELMLFYFDNKTVHFTSILN